MTQRTSAIADLVLALRQVSARAELCIDSRKVGVGDIFVACQGSEGDGRDYIRDAVARGAAAVVHEATLTETQQASLGQVPAWSVSRLRTELGALAAAWWGNPSASLTVVAITGTNGKTTTAHWVAAALQSAGVRCGVIGTLGITDANQQHEASSLTTPDVISLNRSLARLLEQGATHVVMEASSIGLDQGRLDGVQIDVAVFTNLTQDHLDYHGDMSTYALAKARLFARPCLRHAVINVDDEYAPHMRQVCRAPVLTYSMGDRSAGLQACDLSSHEQGQRFTLCHDGQAVDIQTAFVGRHVVANLLAVAGVLFGLGWTIDQMPAALRALPAVPGRLERVQPIGAGSPLPSVIVDYAHTPQALRMALGALAPLVRSRGGRLWCVVGCGGERDRQKRPVMAQIAQTGADQVVLTSDNPRREDPQLILRDMLDGLSDQAGVRLELDRAVAILSAIWQAQDNDVVLIAGKGHEDYQDVMGHLYPFDDRQWGRLALLMRSNAPAVQTDTRRLQPGTLFIALRGDRFDGHDYLSAAQQAGALAAIVERANETVALPQIVLGPTTRALQVLATAWRKRFDIPVIGITGSNGKTTTKEMTASICRQWVGTEATLATTGNLNNEIGVPLTLMALRPRHQVAVIEMGMNHPGEIALLASIVQPTIALVLNAQREHQEFMKSVDAVAQENGQVLCALPVHGTAVYPAGDTYSNLWASLGQQAQTHMTFGDDVQAQVRFSAVEADRLGTEFVMTYRAHQVTIKLAMAGRHNVTNAGAAAACALAAGASLSCVSDALSAFAPVKGRMQLHRLPEGRLLVDDTYNANPDSVRVAIDALAAMPAPRALVLGDMGEVGDLGPQMHAEVGQYAREQDIDYLWAMGRATRATVAAFGEQALWFESAQALYQHARKVEPQSTLVKGSRFMAMEAVVNQWLSAGSSDSQAGSRDAG